MIPGIRCSIQKHQDSPFLRLDSERTLRTLNTSVWNGGFGTCRHIVNRQVGRSYDCSDPAAEMEFFLQTADIPPSDSCAMLTAAFVHEYGYSEQRLTWRDKGTADDDGAAGELRVDAWITAGLGNTARAGDTQPEDGLFPGTAGTVNIILAIDAKLSDAAMASALITVTEAKAAVFQDLRVPVRGSGGAVIATGTTTDAILVASTGAGRQEYLYAGTSTRLGYLIGRAVYEAAADACRRWIAYDRGTSSA